MSLRSVPEEGDTLFLVHFEAFVEGAPAGVAVRGCFARNWLEAQSQARLQYGPEHVADVRVDLVRTVEFNAFDERVDVIHFNRQRTARTAGPRAEVVRLRVA